MTDPERLLSEIARALKPEGVLLVSTPQFVGRQNYISPHHEREFTLPEFRDLLVRTTGNCVPARAVFQPRVIAGLLW